MAAVDVENNADIEFEEEEEDEPGDEEIVVQGSMQFNLAADKVMEAKVAAVSASAVETHPRAGAGDGQTQNNPVPLEDCELKVSGKCAFSVFTALVVSLRNPLFFLVVSATMRTPDGSVVYVIGTAHFSRDSQAKVTEVSSLSTGEGVLLNCVTKNKNHGLVFVAF